VTFFEALTLLDEHSFGVWRKGAAVDFSLSARSAARAVEQAPTDAYVHVAFFAPGKGKEVRGRGKLARPSAADAGGIFGLWLDIDVKGTPDGKGRLKTTPPALDPDRDPTIKSAAKCQRVRLRAARAAS
jgi:hypothetical protein